MTDTVQITVASHTFDYPAMVGFADSQPGIFVAAAVAKMNDFSAAKASINQNPMLSEQGKATQLAPLVEGVWTQMVVSAQNMLGTRKHFDGRRAALYDLGQPVTPFDIANDREIRDWWRALDRDDKTTAINALRDGEEHAGAVLAVLRSPIPGDLRPHEDRLLREAFEKTRRDADPAEAAAIFLGLEAVEHGENVLGRLRGIAYGITGMDVQSVLDLLLLRGNDAGATALLGADRVAEGRRRLEAAGRLRKTA